jgi:plasmid stabilization system protein ParE
MPINEDGKSYQIEIDEAAEKDLDEIIAYYESEKEVLGIEFLLKFYDTVSILKNYPEAFPLAYSRFRKITMKRFPYNIFYFVEDDTQKVIVFAILHNKRGKSYLETRLKDDK